MSIELKPMYVGRCLLNTEYIGVKSRVARGRAPHASVRILQPSSGGDESHYIPPSDVYMSLSAVEAQQLANHFAKLARLIMEIEP